MTWEVARQSRHLLHVTSFRPEVTAGEFPVTLATPVDAGINNSTYRYGLLIQTSTTHDTVSSIAGTQAYQGNDLTWTAPTDQGGLNPTGYKIPNMASASPSSWTTYIDNTRHLNISERLRADTWPAVLIQDHGLEPSRPRVELCHWLCH